MIDNHMPIEAIILAGGLGTRLREVVSDVPKPMAPVNGRPFLEHLMDYWIGQGIQRFILSVGYLADKIESHFGYLYRGCEIRYVHENVPLGTGGGLRHALLKIPFETENSNILVLNGDTWYEVKLQKLVKDARAENKPITMALKPKSNNERYAGVTTDERGNVTQFGISSGEKIHINGGCYLLKALFVKCELQHLPNKFSLEMDFLEPMTRSGRVMSSIQDVTFLDIGLPADYAIAKDILQGKSTNVH